MSLDIHDLICKARVAEAECRGFHYMNASGWRRHWNQKKDWQYLLPNVNIGCIVCGASDKLTCLSNIQTDIEEEMDELL